MSERDWIVEQVWLWMIEHKLPSNQRLVLLALAQKNEQPTAYQPQACGNSLKELASTTGMSPAMLERALRSGRKEPGSPLAKPKQTLGLRVERNFFLRRGK
jgi:hypothetical protein